MERINIIGAGLAGLSAAITLSERGIPCNLISSQPSERAQSVLAEGGINAALDTMGEHDSPEEHRKDTLRSAAGLADPEAVRGLTEHAPEMVEWLVRLGVPLRRENGRLILRSFGGQKKKRTAYAQSSTGKAVMTALIDEVRKYEAAGLVRRWSHHDLLDLHIRDGHCAGVRTADVWQGERQYRPGPVILCCGGLNGLFSGLTTGSVGNTGDAVAHAFLRGVRFGNLEMIQYHPTTVQIPGKRMLISEAARGEGGRLFILRDGKSWYFMEERYPELGNLMPRDVVSREMAQVCARYGGTVYLDMRGLSRAVWRDVLPDLREELRRWLSIDPAKEPVPVAPGIHYFMGGILADRRHRTSLPGLYAAGECACQYHGANRLGGNSMLGALYGGQTAAESAAEDLRQGIGDDRSDDRGGEPYPEEAESPVFRRDMRELLCAGLGVVRDGETLRECLRRLDALLDREKPEGTARGRALLGKAMLLGALNRRESRGAHYRSDCPEQDPAFEAVTTACLRDGEVEIGFQPVLKPDADSDVAANPV